MLRSTGAYGGEKREEVGVAGSPSHLQSGEFRLNLVTKCLWESPFPHLHSEVAPKEFPKHQIQWQQYALPAMIQFREKVIKTLHH